MSGVPETSKAEEIDGYSRLNILMSKEALSKLDTMKDNGGFASRGVALDHLVDSMWEITADVTAIQTISSQNVNNPTIQLSHFLPWMLDIMRRVGKFMRNEDDVRMVQTPSASPPRGASLKVSDSMCAYCGKPLGAEYHFTCHVCSKSYCYVHMGKHAKEHTLKKPAAKQITA